jgi:cell wall-associated NlpC family hydrolase
LRVANFLTTGIAAAAFACGAPAVASAASGGATSGSGGTASGTGGAATATPAPANSGGAGVTTPPPAPSTPSHPTVPGYVAKVIDGVAYAPSLAPIQVQRAIWAGNVIRKKPYIWGGGHSKFNAAGYDCSGSVSYVLHAAGLIKHPMDSSDFMGWGQTGLGAWITVYTNPGHAFIEIAGIRFDTSAEADPDPPKGTGPRWRPLYEDPNGFQARHPVGF